MAEHLVVLGRLVGWDVGIGERVPEADSFDRLLGNALVHVGRVYTDTFEDRRQHVGDMVVLVAGGTGVADAIWPVHDERIADASLVGVLFVEPQWGVADLRPARWVVVVQVRAADFIDSIDHVFRSTADQVEEPQFVEGAVFAALLARPIVGDEHDDRVVEHVHEVEEVDQSPNLDIGVIQESCEGFLHACVELAIRFRQVIPRLDPAIARREGGVWWNDAEFQLTFEPALSDDVPPVVVAAAILLDVVGRGLVRRVGGAKGEVGEEAISRSRSLVGADHADRLVDQIFRHVIPIVIRWVDGMIVDR
jgi:hypothetical protein